MKPNHAYLVSVVLSSSKGNVALSALSGSVIDGQSTPLQTLLGEESTPCAAASLTVDPTIFSIEPSQPQEYSLKQSQITWSWSITPLHVDPQSSQEIRVSLFFSGKSHCGSTDTSSESTYAVTGPYLLANKVSLRIMVSETLSPSTQGPPFFLFLLSVFSLLIFAFLAWLGISLQRRGKTRERHAQPESQKKRLLLMNVGATLNIFYCYAHEDKALRDQLERHLSPLRRSGQIINWYDGEIAPGTVWEERIMMQLNSAHIILLLISPDFIESDYCYSKEMTRAIERHHAGEASVVPIILRPVVWDGMPFADLQVLPSEGKPVCSSRWSTRDEAFYDVVQGIYLVVETLLRHQDKLAP